MSIEHGQILEIINAGIQAPSADNSQPWKFKIGPDNIQVFLDPARVGMFFDYALSASYMSLGAVCENMVLHARKLGMQAEVDLCIDRPAVPEHVFTLNFRKSDATSCDTLADQIPMRTTNRFLYRGRTPVAESVLASIGQSIRPELGCQVIWADELATRKQISRAVFLADLVRFTHPLIHRDFHDKLRFGRAVQDSNDGLAEGTLGVEKLLLPVLKWLRPWGLTRLLNLIGLHYVMAWRGCRLPMWASSNIGVIVASPHVGYFDMGRAFERAWLAATQAGLAFQPLGALPLLLFRAQGQSDADFSDRHLRLLNQADSEWRAGVRRDSADRLVMVFRVGHVVGAAPRSPRRPIDDFLSGEM